MKLKRDFDGICELSCLPNGLFFRTIDKNGKVSKETYIKDSYCRSEKKYLCLKCSDVFGNGRLLKGSQLVTTDFEY